MDTDLASNINNALMVFIIFLCIGIMFLWILFLIFVHRASIEQWPYHDIWERTSKESQDTVAMVQASAELKITINRAVQRVEETSMRMKAINELLKEPLITRIRKFMLRN